MERLRNILTLLTNKIPLTALLDLVKCIYSAVYKMCRETIISCVLDLPFSFGAKNARFLGDSRFLSGIDISGADLCFFCLSLLRASLILRPRFLISFQRRL